MKIWGSLIVAGVFLGCINPTMNDSEKDSSNSNLRQSNLTWNVSGTPGDKKNRNYHRYHKDKRGGHHRDKGCQWKKKDSKPIRAVAGCWSVTQFNGHSGMLHLIQNDSTLSGQMDWYTFSDSPVVGKISGDSISFALEYPDLVPLVGYYYATLDAPGTNLVGTSVSNNGYSADWIAIKSTCPIAP